MQIGVSNSFSRTYRNEGRAGDGPAGGLLQAALHTPTLLSPYDANGQLVERASFDNVQLLIGNYDVNSTSLRYIGNLYGDVQLLPNLKFRTSFGVDYNNYDESEYWNTFLIVGAGVGGLATSSVTQYTSLLNENTLTYRQQFGKHGLGIALLNSGFGDMTAQKIFWLQIGIVPWYQVFTGLVETMAAVAPGLLAHDFPRCSFAARCSRQHRVRQFCLRWRRARVQFLLRAAGGVSDDSGHSEFV